MVLSWKRKVASTYQDVKRELRCLSKLDRVKKIKPVFAFPFANFFMKSKPIVEHVYKGNSNNIMLNAQTPTPELVLPLDV